MYHISHVSNPLNIFPSYIRLLESHQLKISIRPLHVFFPSTPRLCRPHLLAIYSVGRQCPLC